MKERIGAAIRGAAGPDEAVEAVWRLLSDGSGPIMDFERGPDPTKGPYLQVVEDRAWNLPAGAYALVAVDA